MEPITWVLDNWVGITAAATSLMAAASAITALTPTPADDAFMAKFYKLIERIALVVGKAKQSGNTRWGPEQRVS